MATSSAAAGQQQEQQHSISRIYPNANEERGKQWWDYDQLMVAWGVQDNYEVVRKVGRGKVRAHHPLLFSSSTRQGADTRCTPTSTRKCLRASTSSAKRNASSRS